MSVVPMSVVPALSLEAEDLGLSLVAWFDLLSKTKQNEPLATFLLFHSQRKRNLKSRNCITSTLVPCIERGALICTHPLPSSLALTQIVLEGPVLQGPVLRGPVSLRRLLEMQRQISQCCPDLKKFGGIHWVVADQLTRLGWNAVGNRSSLRTGDLVTVPYRWTVAM